LPPVVIAQLGTNGDRSAVSSFDHAVRTALRAVGRRGCVVWPNIVRPPGYEGYNAVLRRLAEKRRNLIVFNWSRMVRRNPGWLADDGVHVNGTGYAARANGIANMVRECRQRVIEATEGEKKRKTGK
jgi:lysophospholipase L1-like esterase